MTEAEWEDHIDKLWEFFRNKPMPIIPILPGQHVFPRSHKVTVYAEDGRYSKLIFCLRV